MDALNTPCQASSSSTSSRSSSSSSTSSKLEEENMNTLKTNTVESSDEEVFTPSKAKKWNVLSSSENEKDENTSDEEKLFSYVNDEKPSLKKFKIQQRCVDSSDEEKVDFNVGLLKTSKVEREKKLLEMRKRVRAKKGLYSSGEESDDTGSDNSGDDGTDNDLDNFVVDDNIVEMVEEKELEEESEEERVVKQTKGKPTDDYVYINPYKEMDDQFEDIDIMLVLSKKTEKDKRNTWKYMEERGKYHESDGDQDDSSVDNDLDDFVVKESEERSQGDHDIDPGSGDDADIDLDDFVVDDDIEMEEETNGIDPL